MGGVFGIRLNADLVSLSACDTGGGKEQKGECVIGLTWAFMYAGASPLAVTLWSVESKSTGMLTTGLFAVLKAGKSR